MNTPSPVAPVRDAIPIRPDGRCGRPMSTIRLALAVALLAICLLAVGPVRAATDQPSTGAGDPAASGAPDSGDGSAVGASASSDPAAQSAPATPAGGTTAGSAGADSRSAAKSLMESDCVAQVRQSTGEQGEITLGDVRSVYTWAPGFLDGSQPSAQPVDTGDWAATATAAGKPVGLLEVVTDKGRTTCTPMFDDDLATDVDQMGDAHLIHDRNANAWYSLRGTTVTALGEAATRRLAGPIELSDYGEILRERAGSKPKTSATQSEARSTTGGWAIWGPVLAVVVVGVATVIITVRHERKVTAPLRQARNRADMAERADRLSRDEPDTRGVAVRRGIPRAAIDLSLLGDGAEGDTGTTDGETLGDTIPESHVNSSRGPRA
ncbi:hypothetical protein [Actinomyces naeslundii]|uniref:Uncharacterized protein n=1 Tax=Actinomyces naeslundii TaxID=1655 RepID=A0AA47FGP7_ACTNA|nr:hypothetical protein [Actinomyces naeslundii]OMG11032.1 hypothetical protein BKH06_07740 [Actinomyces naeslundii]OMG19111.1 hypothetical protein BKH04_00050 [Actinomyces naeslundii]PKY94093.1 hypothetical protein CYJ18_12330 [Actinomyces naeslundii]WAL42926.1 hypothetical protein OFA60_12985 [Actinomyces naeslundii]